MWPRYYTSLLISVLVSLSFHTGARCLSDVLLLPSPVLLAPGSTRAGTLHSLSQPFMLLPDTYLTFLLLGNSLSLGCPFFLDGTIPDVLFRRSQPSPELLTYLEPGLQQKPCPAYPPHQPPNCECPACGRAGSGIPTKTLPLHV